MPFQPVIRFAQASAEALKKYKLFIWSLRWLTRSRLLRERILEWHLTAPEGTIDEQVITGCLGSGPADRHHQSRRSRCPDKPTSCAM
jgi:hypothetical protein